MGDILYRVNITIESKDQFEGEVEGWRRRGRYCGGDKNDQPCMLYFHVYENFTGEKNEDRVEQFCEREVNKVKNKGYSVKESILELQKLKKLEAVKYLSNLLNLV